MVAGSDGIAVHRHRQRRARSSDRRRRARASPFFDATELEVHAIALAPERRHLRRPPRLTARSTTVDRNGAATTFFDPEEKYIWALASDAKGNLYAATGEKGVVYKITPDGKGAPFYKTKATHATSLAVDKAGNLLVGTESPGRVAARGRRRQGIRAPRHAVPGNAHAEVRRQGRALRGRRERPRRTAAAHRPTPSDASPQPTAGPSTGSPVPSVSVSTEITAVVVDSASAGRARAPPGRRRRTSKGAIYRIAPDGLWDLVWDAREDLALRRRVRRRRTADRGHGGQRQDLSPGRQSGPRHAARSRLRVAGHLALPRFAGARLLRDCEPRQDVRGSRRAGAARHLRVRGARRADGLVVGVDQLARRTRAAPARSRSRPDRAISRRRTTPGVPGRPPTRRPDRPSPVPRPATFSGAR